MQSGIQITGYSNSSTVYAGGLVGYGDSVIMLQCGVVGPISQTYLVYGNGQGHNTSAGGIAGYVINDSRITQCTSAGRISLFAIGAGSTADDLYMIYAGGLLGYAGTGSITTKSSASGEVYAQAPYPYAGGLVGYNYGNLDGVQGSTISQSFATGDVSADSASEMPTRPSGLPYAGGLAGYNSGELATITDSYATGNVSAATRTGFAWAGGVVGANANNGLVTRCYATGTVSADAESGKLPYDQPRTYEGSLAGGIVGYNYFTDTTTVTACFGLTSSLSASGQGSTPLVVNRVVARNGYTGDPTPKIGANYGRTGMSLTPSHTPINDPSKEDGGDCAPQPVQGDYAAVGWDFNNVWQMTGAYPTLRP